MGQVQAWPAPRASGAPHRGGNQGNSCGKEEGPPGSGPQVHSNVPGLRWQCRIQGLGEAVMSRPHLPGAWAPSIPI